MILDKQTQEDKELSEALQDMQRCIARLQGVLKPLAPLQAPNKAGRGLSRSQPT